MAFDRRSLLRALPNALTLGNGVCGVAALVILASDVPDRIRIAGGLIFLGWLFDMVDGIAARRLDVSGPFGAALDSLCDAVTFGALPAVLLCAAYDGVVTLVAAFGFACCALLRLARYTAQTSQHAGERWYFDGLPSPAAALMVATATMLQLPEWQSTVIALAASVAMVSQLPYADVPRFYLSRRWPWLTAALPLVAAAIFGLGPVTAAILGLYLLSGPMVHVARGRTAAVRGP